MKDVDAANLILGKAGEGNRFIVYWGWLKLKLSIPPVTTKTLIRISREIAYLPEIDPEAQMFPQMLSTADNMSHICMAITYATRTKRRFLVYRAIRSIPIQDIKTLWGFVMQQSDPTSFFFIMVSAKGMNKMKSENQEKQEEGTPSSDVSQ
jgi:hypothetical protein